jgi:phosphatidylglycerophosphate synthase
MGEGMVVEDRVEEARRSLAASYRQARAHRGEGDLFTRLVNDRLGWSVAAVGIRLGIHPTVITLVDLALALLASLVVITHAEQAHGWWAPGLIGFIGWQLAYVLDCADGQVARATGKKSEFGARVDILVDFAVQSSMICSLVGVITHVSHPSMVLLGLFAVTWPVNLFTWALTRADENVEHSLIRAKSAAISVVKLARDYGFVLLVLSGWLVAAPQSLIIPVVAVTFVNVAFLAASITREAWLSIRARTME